MITSPRSLDRPGTFLRADGVSGTADGSPDAAAPGVAEDASSPTGDTPGVDASPAPAPAPSETPAADASAAPASGEGSGFPDAAPAAPEGDPSTPGWHDVEGGRIARTSGTTQKDILTALWPEKGSALTVQYAVSSLRVRAERKDKPRVKDYLEPAHLLEAQGIAVVVSDRNGSVYYASPGADSSLSGPL